MPISITCPGCGKRLKARDELAGKVLPCPHCKEPVHVAQPEDEIANLLLQDERPAEAPSPPEPEPEEEAAEERPAPVRRQRPRRRAQALAIGRAEQTPPAATAAAPRWYPPRSGRCPC